MYKKKSKYEADRDLLKDIIEHLIDGGRIYHRKIGFKPIPDTLKEHYIKLLKEHFGFSEESIKYLK